MEITLDSLNSSLQSINPKDFIKDESGNLILICIKNNEGVTSNVMQDVVLGSPNAHVIHKARGVIFDKRDGKCINDRTMYPYEYQSNELERMKKDFDGLAIDMSSLKYSWAIEGTVLRVFHFDDVWHISTHRKIDADKSAWRTNVSFKKMFEATVEEKNFEKFCESNLDTSLQYTFLLTANEITRFVCNQTTNHQPIYIIEIYDVNNKCTIDQEANPLKDIQFLPSLDNIPETLEEAFHLVQELKFDFMNFRLEDQSTEFGLMMHSPSKKMSFRIVNEMYQKYFNIIGNSKSIEDQYLMNITNPDNLSIISYLNPALREAFTKMDRAKQQLPLTLARLLAKRVTDKTSVHLKPRYEWARGFEATLFCQDFECINELIMFSKNEKNVKDSEIQTLYPNLLQAVQISIDHFLTDAPGRPHVNLCVHIKNYTKSLKNKIVLRDSPESSPQTLTIESLSSKKVAMDVTLSSRRQKKFLLFESNTTFHKFASNAILINIRKLDFEEVTFNPRTFDDDIVSKKIRIDVMKKHEKPKIFYYDFMYRSSEGKDEMLTICISSSSKQSKDETRKLFPKQIKEFIFNDNSRSKCQGQTHVSHQIQYQAESQSDAWRKIHDAWSKDSNARRMK